MPRQDWPNVSGETAGLIVQDVAEGVDPKNSKRVRYGLEEIAFYKDVVADVKRQNIKVMDVRE